MPPHSPIRTAGPVGPFTGVKFEPTTERDSLVTVAAADDYGKPRPALVVPSDFFREHPSVNLCLIPSDLRDTPLFQLTIHPSPDNGLHTPSQVMADKIMTLAREKVRDVSGRVENKSMVEVNRALAPWVEPA